MINFDAATSISFSPVLKVFFDNPPLRQRHFPHQQAFWLATPRSDVPRLRAGLFIDLWRFVTVSFVLPSWSSSTKVTNGRPAPSVGVTLTSVAAKEGMFLDFPTFGWGFLTASASRFVESLCRCALSLAHRILLILVVVLPASLLRGWLFTRSYP